MQTRLHALNMLDRAFGEVTDEEIVALVADLPEDHAELLAKVAGSTPAEIREAAKAGKMDSTLENIGALLTDKCLSDCVEALGTAADDPSVIQLAEVVPGLVEKHGKAVTQVMFACTMAGEAKAAINIRELLKDNEHIAMAPVAMRDFTAGVVRNVDDSAERAAVLEARKARKEAEKIAAKAAAAKAAAARTKPKK